MSRHKDDATWKDDWTRSHAAVKAVVKWLNDNGYEAEEAPQKGLRPEYGVEGYTDDGDILLPSGIGEVKRLSRKHNFTTRESFPYQHVTICEQYSYDRYEKDNKQPPTFYFIVNDALTHFIIVPVAQTRDDWYILRQFDSKVRERRPFYHLPKTDERLRFMAFLPVLDLPVEEDYPRSAWDIDY